MQKEVTNTSKTVKKGVKRLIPLFVAILFLFASMAVVYASVMDVSILDGDNMTAVKTLKTDPYEILAENNIEVAAGDQVIMNDLGNEIRIKRAKNVQILVDGQMLNVSCCGETVGDALEEAGLTIGSEDQVSVPLDTRLQKGMQIFVTRIVEKLETVVETIDFATKDVSTSALKEGESRVKTEGQKGEVTKEYKVIYKDGEEISRELISENVTKDPVTKVVEHGQKTTVQAVNASAQTASGSSNSVSRSIGGLRYKKVLKCSATAYTLTKGSSGLTASGMKARVGVIAVDPRVIPLGTRVYIETTDGKFIYGTAVAGDTGGAIKGNIVDLFFNTLQECYNFGRRNVNVYILE